LVDTCRTFVLGSAETTAGVLSGATYYLLLNPECMRELVTEIRSAFTSENDINMSTVLDLTYMGAVITETMRLFHPLPGNLRRMAPAEGSTISGHFIPGNTIVACDMYAAGRSSSNFARPSDFVPERHLPDAPEEFRNGKLKAVQAVS
jgi:cytochrome P450